MKKIIKFQYLWNGERCLVSWALKISEAASLAMHSAGLLGSDVSTPMSTKTIATVFNISEAHLSKVLQRLVKVGLLKSLRGPKGGFSLAKEPGSITLLEVYEATEGPIDPTNCLFSLSDCDGKNCILGHVLADANSHLKNYLVTTTLADIQHVFKQERFQIPDLTAGQDGTEKE